MDKNKDIAQQFAKEIIDLLKSGTAPWQKPWEESIPQPPFNPVTGTVYRGVNRVMLGSKGLDDPRWMTLKQANEQGYRVKKGSKSNRIVFWHWSDEKKVLDKDGNPVRDAEGNQVVEKLERSRPLLHVYSVFHASQLQTEDGKDLPLFGGRTLTWDPNEKAEAILNHSGASISHDQHNRAYYLPSTDEIHLPPREKFPSDDRYYSTALHELGHYTGHPSRLNREFGPFGSKSYAKEELRAEIASWMVSQELGIPHDPGQHAAYVDNWIKVLEDNPYEILYACQAAEKITEYVMGLEQKKEIEQVSPAEQEMLPQKMTEENQEIAADIRRAMADMGRWDDIAAAREANKHAASALQALTDGDELSASASMRQAAEVEIHQGVDAGSNSTFTDILLTMESPTIQPEIGMFIVSGGSPDLIAGRPAPIYQEFNTAQEAGAAFRQLCNDHNQLFCEYQSDDTQYDLASWNNGHMEWKGEYPAPQAMKDDFLAGYQAAGQSFLEEKTYLKVPYREKDVAKAAGAKWDGNEKAWYAPEGTPINTIAAWLPSPEPNPSPVLPPQEEFAQAIRNAGLLLEGSPVMDGQIHRVPVENGKLGAKDGAYCGHVDGRPNGWTQNFKTGERTKWIATGQVMSETKKAELKQEISDQLSARDQERRAEQEKAGKRAYARWMNADPVQEHPYLQRKGVDGLALRQNQDGNLLVPGYDLETGRLQTLQHISPTGGKWFEKQCPKTGAVCILPDKDALQNQEIVLIAEGYATGASLHRATGLPVAIAFDTGNLKEAALAIRKHLPAAAITICADSDHSHPSGQNIGVDKAREAAAAVGGTVIVPELTKEEKSQGLTDFNDLHQSRGEEAVCEIVKEHTAELVEAETEVER